jgi:uncharacterized protein (DUF2147 family)
MNLSARLLICWLLLALTLQSAVAADPSPVGRWEVTTGESRFDVVYCGDGKELCAVLVWLRPDARTEENLAQLHKYVVRKARPEDDKTTWTGEVLFDGKSYRGTMTLISNNRMSVHSCMGLLCDTFELARL